MNKVITPVIAAFFGSLGGYFAASNQQPQIQANIQAQSFQLVDSRGAVRATFGMTRNGPMLVMSDFEGRERFGVAVGNDGANLAILDASGGLAVHFGTRDGETEIALHYPNGRTASSLRIASNGSAEISIEESRGRSKAVLGTNPDGKSYLAIEDPDASQKRLEMMSGAGSNPMINLSAMQGKQATIHFDSQGNPVFSLLNTGTQGPQEMTLKANMAEFFGLLLSNGNEQNAAVSLQSDGDAKLSLKPLGGAEKRMTGRG